MKSTSPLNSIDRLTRLWAYYFGDVKPTVGSNGAGMHDLINELDDAASIDTGWLDGHDGCCARFSSGGSCRMPVGARLALHETHVFASAPDSDGTSASHWGMFN
jgi:hypothetical protein